MLLPLYARLIGGMMMLTAAAAQDVVTPWNHLVRDIISSTKNLSAANEGTRLWAAVHLAQYRAVEDVLKSHNLTRDSACADNATVDSIRPSIQAAIARAGRDALVPLAPPGANESIHALYDEQVSSLGQTEQRALDIGASRGQAVAANRTNDGAERYDDKPYLGSNGTGKWRPTPPKYLPAGAPHWPRVKTWVLSSPNEMKFAPPPALDSQEYREAYDEVMAVGNRTSSVRTADQSDIGLFWQANPEVTIFQVVEQVANRSTCPLLDSVRLYALTSVTAADSRIATLHNKYLFSTWRPVSSIRLGNGVGFPADPYWNSVRDTPNNPDYVSAHATLGGGFTEVVRLVTGTDNHTIALESQSLQGKTRTYNTLTQLSHEVADSRVYSGEHFRFSSSQVVIDKGAYVAQIVVEALDSDVWSSSSNSSVGGGGVGGREDVATKEEGAVSGSGRLRGR